MLECICNMSCSVHASSQKLEPKGMEGIGKPNNLRTKVLNPATSFKKEGLMKMIANTKGQSQDAY